MSKAHENLGSNDPGASAIAIDQLWDGDGYTRYTFDDNSVLILSGRRQYVMDANSVVSITGYAAWLGSDVQYEQAEIDRLLGEIEQT